MVYVPMVYVPMVYVPMVYADIDIPVETCTRYPPLKELNNPTRISEVVMQSGSSCKFQSERFVTCWNMLYSTSDSEHVRRFFHPPSK